MAGHRYSRLIEPWLGIWPVLAALVFAVVETSQSLGYTIPWVHWYLNDLICMPIFVAISISLERLLSGKLELLYGLLKVLFYLLIISLVFEVFLPLKSSNYTSDLADVFFYLIGTVFTFCFSPCIDRRLRFSFLRF